VVRFPFVHAIRHGRKEEPSARPHATSLENRRWNQLEAQRFPRVPFMVSASGSDMGKAVIAGPRVASPISKLIQSSWKRPISAASSSYYNLSTRQNASDTSSKAVQRKRNSE